MSKKVLKMKFTVLLAEIFQVLLNHVLYCWGCRGTLQSALSFYLVGGGSMCYEVIDEYAFRDVHVWHKFRYWFGVCKGDWLEV